MKRTRLLCHFIRFTLVELLVVVAIIGILVSMLLPAVSKAREKAKQMSCLGNMKQIGVAFNQYCDDYQGYMPITYKSEVYRNWTYYFAPYFGLTVESSPVPKYYICPSKPPLDSMFTKISKVYPNNYLGSSNSVYRPNQENGFDGIAISWYRVRKIFSVMKPSMYIPFGEAESSVDGDFYFRWGNDPTNRTLGINSHAGGQANYLHADGHAVKMIIPEAMRGNSKYNWNFYVKGIPEEGPIQ